MAGLCESGNELSGSLKASKVHTCGVTVSASGCETRWSGFESRSGQVTWLRFFPGVSLNPIRASAGMYQLDPSATGLMDGIAPLPQRHNNTDEVRHISFLSLFTVRQDTSQSL
ncbi:hypothetical protein ANN_23035 [Periplaneta americana]|uniref:Uncharacterized protein n=1 Tax=Periplaneta americana TaxID=6978 RepID=A0ABQ8SJY7_PERAM|nr:hypothetical protein ANN_23035 [Periplaneta americana]